MKSISQKMPTMFFQRSTKDLLFQLTVLHTFIVYILGELSLR